MIARLQQRVFEDHREAVEREAAEMGVEVLAVESHQAAHPSMANEVGRLLRMAALGSAATAPTHMQLYQLAVPGFPFLYAEAFRGSLVTLPGEFHIRLSGSLPQPVALTRGLIKRRWLTNGDTALLDRLRLSVPLQRATRKLRWKRHNGSEVFQLEWTVQIVALGDRSSHLVFQSGGYGPIRTRPGLAELFALTDAIVPLLANEAYPAQRCYAESQFAEAFAALEHQLASAEGAGASSDPPHVG